MTAHKNFLNFILTSIVVGDEEKYLEPSWFILDV
jgi:hypothetical protein